MKTTDRTIQEIKRELIQTFALLDECFDSHQEVMAKKSANGGWSIAETLEHIMLTNQYFLTQISMESTTEKQMVTRENLPELLSANQFEFSETEIGRVVEAFNSNFPNSTAPLSQSSAELIRGELRWQLYQCLQLLNEMLNDDKGISHGITTTAHFPEKMNVYGGLCFLASYAQRYLRQMKGTKITSQDAH